MKTTLAVSLFLSCVIHYGLSGQSQFSLSPVSSTTMSPIHKTAELRTLVDKFNSPKKLKRAEKLGNVSRSYWPEHSTTNDAALPTSGDPILQQNNLQLTQGILIDNFHGQSYTAVNPSDGNVDVSATHIIQMVNDPGGSKVNLYDKSGNLLVPSFYLSDISTLPGFADPIVIYDHQADRWLLSEIGANQDRIILCISDTPDPLGTYSVYGLNTPGFPDYQKIGVWSDSYVITTHENPHAIYAIERAQMIVGGVPQILRFSIPTFPSVNFLSSTPVSITGSTPPPANTPAMVLRLQDDAWGSNIAQDELHIWEINLDWANPVNSFLFGPAPIATSPFDTEFCGLNDYSCITQPGSTIELDPIKEMIMNRVYYRNFGSHASIVANHTVDVSGTNHAGIRWYELRKNTNWSVYQEGTYAPDSDHRFMGGITINGAGHIGLAYNVSGSNTYPSLRFTGRKASDPLGQMTAVEIPIRTGAASNGSSRYGDYNVLVIDPLDDQTFWFSGSYNMTSQWTTNINSFKLEESVLSTTWTTFDAVLEDMSVRLSWSVENSTELDYFKVMRRDEGASEEEYTEIGRTNSTGGDTSFEFLDHQIISGGRYEYQIVAIDRDGLSSNSDLRSIAVKNISTEFLIYPNPIIDNRLYIRMNSAYERDLLSVKVHNLAGQLVAEEKIEISNTLHELNLPAAVSGLLTISIWKDGSMIERQQLVK